MVKSKSPVKPSRDPRLTELCKQIATLQDELRAAIARKPNAALSQLVYQLRMTRVELAAVQEKLGDNTAVLKRYVEAIERGAPILSPADLPIG